MTQWSQHNLHKHMYVHSCDNKHLGQIAEVYAKSFLLHKGFFFPKDRYIPYSAIATVDHNQVRLKVSASEAQEMMWEARAGYEDHLGDPTQLFYDRGHGIHDPCEETNPEKM